MDSFHKLGFPVFIHTTVKDNVRTVDTVAPVSDDRRVLSGNEVDDALLAQVDKYRIGLVSVESRLLGNIALVHIAVI